MEMINIRGQTFGTKNQRIELLKKAVASTKNMSMRIGTALKTIEGHMKEGEKDV